jgi:hypothetical protein
MSEKTIRKVFGDALCAKVDEYAEVKGLSFDEVVQKVARAGVSRLWALHRDSAKRSGEKAPRKKAAKKKKKKKTAKKKAADTGSNGLSAKEKARAAAERAKKRATPRPKRKRDSSDQGADSSDQVAITA